MRYRFFIDECLSPELVAMAREAGYEATCSRDLGLSGMKDWKLIEVVVSGDYTLSHKMLIFEALGKTTPAAGTLSKQFTPGWSAWARSCVSTC